MSREVAHDFMLVDSSSCAVSPNLFYPWPRSRVRNRHGMTTPANNMYVGRLDLRKHFQLYAVCIPFRVYVFLQ